MSWNSYIEYKLEILKSRELYYMWNYDDFHWLIEGEPKSVRYVLHVVWDLLNTIEVENNAVKEVLLDKAWKFFTFVRGEVRNPKLRSLIEDRFKENGMCVDG